MINQHERFPRFLYLVLVCAVLLLVQPSTFAQTDTGRIVGTVTDQNGAVVHGATILVKNERTGEERTVTSTEEGIYIVPSLKASTYTVTVTGQNLTAKAEDVQLNVGQELNLNLTLLPAGIGAEVTVVGEAEAPLDTISARMGAASPTRPTPSHS
jgi:hypothetical protein